MTEQGPDREPKEVSATMVKKNLISPGVLVICLFAFLMVATRFAVVFEDIGVSPPIILAVVIKASRLLRNIGFFPLMGAILIVVSSIIWASGIYIYRKRGRANADRLNPVFAVSKSDF